MKPFENENESTQIEDLTLENRTDRVSIYGNIDITLDKVGLDNAIKLKKVVDDIVAELSRKELPGRIEIKKSQTVKNPFA